MEESRNQKLVGAPIELKRKCDLHGIQYLLVGGPLLSAIKYKCMLEDDTNTIEGNLKFYDKLFRKGVSIVHGFPTYLGRFRSKRI